MASLSYHKSLTSQSSNKGGMTSVSNPHNPINQKSNSSNLGIHQISQPITLNVEAELSTLADFVVINISGTPFLITEGAFLKIKRTVAEKARIIDNKQFKRKEYFFTRNINCFISILDFIENGELHYSASMCPLELKQELDFWGISEENLGPCCRQAVDDAKVDSEILEKYELQRMKECTGISTQWQRIKRIGSYAMEYPYSSKLAKAILAIKFIAMLAFMFQISISSYSSFSTKITYTELPAYMKLHEDTFLRLCEADPFWEYNKKTYRLCDIFRTLQNITDDYNTSTYDTPLRKKREIGDNGQHTYRFNTQLLKLSRKNNFKENNNDDSIPKLKYDFNINKTMISKTETILKMHESKQHIQKDKLLRPITFAQNKQKMEMEIYMKPSQLAVTQEDSNENDIQTYKHMMFGYNTPYQQPIYQKYYIAQEQLDGRDIETQSREETTTLSLMVDDFQQFGSVNDKHNTSYRPDDLKRKTYLNTTSKHAGENQKTVSHDMEQHNLREPHQASGIQLNKVHQAVNERHTRKEGATLDKPQYDARKRRSLVEIRYSKDEHKDKIEDIVLFVSDEWIDTFGYVITIYFILEYLSEIIFACDKIRYIVSFHSCVDIVTIFSSLMLLIIKVKFPELYYAETWVYALRMVEAFKNFKLFYLLRNTNMFLTFRFTISKNFKKFFWLTLFVFWLLAIGSVFMYYMDTDVMKSVPGAMWWSIITVTTVGYGSIVPMSMFGKVYGCCVAWTGVVLVALAGPIFVTDFMSFYNLFSYLNEASSQDEIVRKETKQALRRRAGRIEKPMPIQEQSFIKSYLSTMKTSLD